jgi:hypothetical protein
MKPFLVQYTDPSTKDILSTVILSEDKTSARDLFFKEFVDVEEIIKIKYLVL